MKDTDGNKIAMSGTSYVGGDRIFIDDEYKDEVLDALSVENGHVSFYVDSDMDLHSYLFTVDNKDFAEVYRDAMN